MRGPTSPTCRRCCRRRRLVQRDQSDTIKFTAPQKPGEYNFLCSFPGHWVRMYGVMLVVPSLDAFEAKPTVPNDPMTGKPYESQRVIVK